MNKPATFKASYNIFSLVSQNFPQEFVLSHMKRRIVYIKKCNRYKMVLCILFVSAQPQLVDPVFQNGIGLTELVLGLLMSVKLRFS